MAVIRQKTQVFNKPVGVRRINTGEAEMWEQISQQADQLTARAFEAAANNARTVGEETALAQSSKQISTINPLTNEPEAYTPPAEFGEFAAAAYQSMINRRFEESVNSELTAMGASIASSSKSASQYRDDMSKHVNNMYNAAGENTYYSRYITEKGTNYVHKTYESLKAKEIEETKAAIERQQIVASIHAGRNIAQQIALGIDHKKIEEDIGIEYIRASDLFKTGAITPSQYNSALDTLDGYRALSSNNSLAQIYSNMTEANQNLLMMGIDNPNVLMTLSNDTGIGNLNELVSVASIARGKDTLRSSLKASQEAASNVQQDNTATLVSKLTPQIALSPSFNTINMATSSIADPKLRYQVKTELYANLLEKKLDFITSGSSNRLDELVVDLLDSSSAFGSINNVKDKKIISELKSLTMEERKTLSQKLNDKRSAKARLEGVDIKKAENALRSQALAFSASTDLTKDYKELRKKINDSSLSSATKISLTNEIGEHYTKISLLKARDILLESADELTAVLDALVTGNNISLTTQAQKDKYNMLRPAFDESRTVVSSALNQEILSIKNQTKLTIEANTNLESGIGFNNGIGQSPENIKKYIDQYLANEVLSASNIMLFPEVNKLMEQGILVPQVLDVLSSSLTSSSELDIEAAMNIWEQYTNLKVTGSDQRDLPLDLLRASMTQEDYARYSAASYIGRSEGRSPASILIELRNYSGDLSKDVLFDVTGKRQGVLKDILKEVRASPQYSEQILSVIKIKKARGITITKEVITETISSFTKNMIKDPNVFGPNIGDSTVFAIQGYLTTKEILAARNFFTNKLALHPDNKYANYLRGGTAADAFIRAAGQSFGFNFWDGMLGVKDKITGGYQNLVNMNDNQRIIDGGRALNFNVIFQPDVASFDAGKPQWLIGIPSENGGFEPFTIDGMPQYMTKPKDVSNITTAALVNYQQSISRGGTKAEQVTAEIQYLATLPHFTEKHFMSNAAEQFRFSGIRTGLGSNARVLEVFRAKRKAYNEKDLVE